MLIFPWKDLTMPVGKLALLSTDKNNRSKKGSMSFQGQWISEIAICCKAHVLLIKSCLSFSAWRILFLLSPPKSFFLPIFLSCFFSVYFSSLNLWLSLMLKKKGRKAKAYRNQHSQSLVFYCLFTVQHCLLICGREQQGRLFHAVFIADMWNQEKQSRSWLPLRVAPSARIQFP